MLILNKKTDDIDNIIKTNLDITLLDSYINDSDINTEQLHSVLKVLDYYVVVYLSNKRAGKLKLTARLLSDFTNGNNRTKLTEIYSIDLKRNEEDKFINAPDIADTIIINIPNLIYEHLFKKDNAFFNLIKNSLGSDYRDSIIKSLGDEINDVKSYYYSYVPVSEQTTYQEEEEEGENEQQKFQYEEF